MRKVWYESTEAANKKGGKRLYEYFVAAGGLNAAKYGVQSIAEGKYLKFAYEVLSANGIIRMQIKDMVAAVCPECNFKVFCIKKETEGRLSAFCIDGLLTLCFEKT